MRLAALGAQQVMAVVTAPGMVAGDVGLRGLEPVHQADPNQEIQMPVDGQRSDLSLLPSFQQCDEFVRRHRPIAGQQFRISRQPGRGQPRAQRRAARLGAFAPSRRNGRRFCQTLIQLKSPSRLRLRIASTRRGAASFKARPDARRAGDTPRRSRSIPAVRTGPPGLPGPRTPRCPRRQALPRRPRAHRVCEKNSSEGST